MKSVVSKTSPVLSVIIPSYNQLEGLQKTIHAFCSLREKGVEIIVVDGESNDGSVDWIYSNSSNIDQMIIESDSGIYEAMNKGIKLARSEWIWFMGTGDCPVIKGAKEMLHIVENGAIVTQETPPEMLAFGVHLLAPREPGVPEFYKPSWNVELVWRNTIHHQGAIYSRKLFTSEMYDVRFPVLADYHFHLKIWKQGVICWCSPSVVSEVAPGGVSRDFSLSLYREERLLKQTVLSGWQNVVQGLWTRSKWLKKKIGIYM